MGTRASDLLWCHVLDRAVFGAAALMIAIQTVVVASGWSNLAETEAGQPLLAIRILCGAVLTLLSLEAALRGPRRSRLFVALAVGILGMVAGAMIRWPATTRSEETALLVGLWSLESVTLILLLVARRTWQRVAFVVAAVALYLIAAGPASVGLAEVDNCVGATAGAIAIALLVSYLRRGAVEADRLHARVAAARRDLIERESARDRARETRRLMHDEVIGALTALSMDLPGPGRQAACQRALDELTRRVPPVTRAELLERLVADSPVALEVVDHGWRTQPPASVLDSFRQAAAEALRNVARHSGVDVAHLETSRSGSTVVLSIRDRGKGPGDHRPGFGIQHSVQAPMRHAGGSAEVVPAGERGTLVRLTWSPEEAPPYAVGPNPLAARNRAAVYLRCVMPLALAYVWFALHRDTDSRLVNLLAAALVLAGLVFGARWIARSPLGGRSVLAAGVGVAAVTALGLSVLPPGSLMNLNSWVVDASGLVLILCAFEARARTLVLPVLLQVGVIAWFAGRDPGLGLLEPVGLYSTTTVHATFAVGIGRLIGFGEREILSAQAELTGRLTEEARERAADQARQDVMVSLDREAAALLRQVAGGQDPRDAAERAALLAARMRDGLHQPHPLSEELRAEVDAARARGITIGLRSAPSGPNPPCDDGLAELLRVAAQAPTTDVITVFRGPAPRLVIVPPLRRADWPIVQREDGFRLQIDSDRERTVLTLTTSDDR